MKEVWPRVIANFAITADGKTSTRNRTPSGFTAPADLDNLRRIRSLGDAVMVGAGTLCSDHMSLALSSKTKQRERIERGQSPEPLRVIVSNRGRISTQEKVFRSGSTPPVIFSTQEIPSGKRQELSSIADLWLFNGSRVNLSIVLTILRREYGIRNLICEGGPSLFRSLLEISAIDELHLTWSPQVFGGTKAPTITSLPGDFLPRSARGRLANLHIADGECYLTYRFSRRS